MIIREYLPQSILSSFPSRRWPTTQASPSAQYDAASFILVELLQRNSSHPPRAAIPGPVVEEEQQQKQLEERDEPVVEDVKEDKHEDDEEDDDEDEDDDKEEGAQDVSVSVLHRLSAIDGLVKAAIDVGYTRIGDIFQSVDGFSE
ncbi:hypothetical protein Ancab_010623 [Ancistrocladus abbreviatus]